MNIQQPGCTAAEDAQRHSVKEKLIQGFKTEIANDIPDEMKTVSKKIIINP